VGRRGGEGRGPAGPTGLTTGCGVGEPCACEDTMGVATRGYCPPETEGIGGGTEEGVSGEATA
jgi:hypothetical protein